MDPAAVERQIADLEFQAALARQNPPPAEKAERQRRADQLDQEAAGLRQTLSEHLRAKRAANQAARDADTVLVRFVRDLPTDCLIDNVTVLAARGPVRQRQGQPATPVSTVAREVSLQDGEVRELPGEAGRVLLDAGYVRVLTDPGEVEQARAELVAAGRQGG